MDFSSEKKEFGGEIFSIKIDIECGISPSWNSRLSKQSNID